MEEKLISNKEDTAKKKLEAMHKSKYAQNDLLPTAHGVVKNREEVKGYRIEKSKITFARPDSNCHFCENHLLIYVKLMKAFMKFHQIYQ